MVLRNPHTYREDAPELSHNQAWWYCDAASNDRARLPPVWLNELSPFDPKLNCLTQVVTWHGEVLGDEERLGAIRVQRLCQKRRKEWCETTKRSVSVVIGLESVLYPNEWCEKVKFAKRPCDFFPAGSPLAGWSRHGPRCCLDVWKCGGDRRCIFSELYVGPAYKSKYLNGAKTVCTGCGAFRPYPSLPMEELWSMQRTQRLCCDPHHNHGGDNDNGRAKARRFKNQQPGRQKGGFY